MFIGNVECYGIIYKITNKVNGKSYIGQTIKPNGYNDRYCFKGVGIERVYNYHNWQKQQNRGYNSHLLHSIRKYGFDNFDVIEVLDVAFSKSELDIKEDMYINLFNCISNGYNHKSGGSNGSPSKELREKLSKALKGKFVGENNPMYGVHRYGEENPMYGVHRYGRDNPNSKAVKCITTEKIFYTIREAGDFYDIKDPYTISGCCKGKQKTAGKLRDGTRLKWEFVSSHSA